MPARRQDRVSTLLLALATVTVSGAFVNGLLVAPRAAGADATKPADGLGGFDGFDPDVFSSSEPAKGMGGGGGGMGGGMGGGGGAAGGGAAGGGSSSGGSSTPAPNPQSGGSQPTSGGSFSGGGGMGGSTSSGGGGGATSGAMSSGGTPAAGGATAGAKAKPTTGAAGGSSGKSSATSSKASKARIAWLGAQAKARWNDALEGIYQAELKSLNGGAFLALRRAACPAGPGSTTPVPTTPAPGAPAAPPSAAPAAPTPDANEKPPTLTDGAALPKGCDELQALAEKCEKDARYDDALIAVQSLVKVRGSARDFAYQGFLEEQYGTYEGADEAYGKSLAIEPTHVGAKVGMAFVNVAFGKAQAFCDGLAKDVNAPKGDVLWLLATSFASNVAKLAEPARAALEQAVTAAGQDVPKLRAAIELGIEMKVRGPLVLALDICLRSAPDDPKFHGLRFVLAVEEGPPAAAAAALEDAVKLQPGDVEPLFFLAYLELKDDKNDKALTILKNALKIAPTNGRCALLEAHTLDRKGSKETLMAYAHAAELDPKSAEPWIASALIVHNKADYEDAEGKLQAAIKAEPRNPEPLYYLAIIQGDRQGFLGKAEDTLKLYRKLGGEDEAALAWLQSLEDAANN